MGSGGGGEPNEVPVTGGGLYGKYPAGAGLYPAGGGYEPVWDGGVVVVVGVIGVTEPVPVGGG
jgi:hypothetical protein